MVDALISVVLFVATVILLMVISAMSDFDDN